MAGRRIGGSKLEVLLLGYRIRLKVASINIMIKREWSKYFQYR